MSKPIGSWNVPRVANYKHTGASPSHDINDREQIACFANDCGGGAATEGCLIELEGEACEALTVALEDLLEVPGSVTMTPEEMPNSGDIQATCVMLNAFQNEVQAASGKKIAPASVADELIGEAQDIMDAMSCSRETRPICSEAPASRRGVCLQDRQAWTVHGRSWPVAPERATAPGLTAAPDK